MRHHTFVKLLTASLAALPITGCLDVEYDDALDPDRAAELAEVTGVSEAELRTTTPAGLPNNITLGQLDDAAGTNLIQYDRHRLFVTRTDFAGTPVMHHYYESAISSLIVGDFAVAGTREHGHDQVCAILTNGAMQCHAPSDDRTELWWWFTQPNPLAAGERPIVGDFTGDGADDILAFDASGGTVRLLSRTQTGFFAPVSAYTPGNLASFNLVGKQLYAGEYGQTAGRADLLVVDRSTRQVIRLDTATDTSGRTTFWWAFTSNGDALLPNEQITVANIDGGLRDGLLLRDPATGRYRAVSVEYQNGLLRPIPSTTVSLGQLPVTTHSGILAAARLAVQAGEPGALRDDTLFFDRTDDTMISTEARYDGTRHTYWWSYTQVTPRQLGWSPRQNTPMALILCKLADVSRTPDQAAITRTLLGRGSGGVRDYLFQVSYGTIDIANASVYGWVTSSLKAADSSSRDGGFLKTSDYIRDCAAKADVDISAVDGHVLVVLNDTNVSFQGINDYGATVDYQRVADGQISAISHEVLHAFGLNHANDDSARLCGGSSGGAYCDTADVMGNFHSTDIVRADGSSTGPELNAGHRYDLSVLPTTRVATLDPATAPARTVVTLAPLAQPEAAGHLAVRILDGGTYEYFVEYRRPVLLDANIGTTGIRVVRSRGGGTTLQTSPASTLTAGMTARVGAFTLRVDSIDNATGHATVSLTH